MSQSNAQEAVSLSRRASIDKKTDEYKIDPTNKLRILPPNDHPHSKLLTYAPIAYWIPNYDFKLYLAGDIVAGLTAGVMLIPQGMAYALIAGLDPIYGLYSSMFGPLIYMIFGTSGQLSVAPVAIVSLLTAEGVESQITHTIDPITGEETYSSIEYLALASILAFQVGLIQTILGLLNAGVIASMLSHSVIVGFTGAAGFLIGMSQIKHCLKISIKRGEFFEMLIDLFKNIHNTSWETLLLSLVCIFILLILKTWKKKKNWYGNKYAQFIPGALIVVVLSTLFSYLVNDSELFSIIGKQEDGLPNIKNFFNNIDDLSQFWSLWVTSILISIIGFLESYAVANKYAEMKNYSINASQELFSLGATNIVGCWFQCYPITGGLSRTAVAAAAGANTPLNSGIQGLFMIFALSVLLSLFEWLPNACLGSIVLVSVINLVDYKAMIHLWKLKRRDFWVMLITLLVTLLLGIEVGVTTGVVSSLLMFVQRASKPHYAILGKLENEKNVWRNIKNYSNAIQRNDMLIIRWDASLFFANINVFKKRILKHIGRFLNENNYPKDWCLVLNFNGINDCDASAAESLYSFFDDLIKKFDGFQLLITNLKKPVRLVLDVAEVTDIIGEERLFFEMPDAEKYWNQHMNIINANSNSINSNDGNSDGHDGKPLLNDDSIKQNKNKDQSSDNLSTQEMIDNTINNNDEKDENKNSKNNINESEFENNNNNNSNNDIKLNVIDNSNQQDQNS